MAYVESVEKFDCVAEEYHKSRPEYSKKLLDYIDGEFKFNENSSLLEIGAGTGIATKQFAEKWNCKIVALEPGEKLINKAKENCASFNKIDFVKCLFKDYENSEKFDAIVAATSFHWLDSSVKFEKCSECLKDDGKLILFWVYFRLHDLELRALQQDIYERNGLGGYRTNLVEYQESKMSQRRNEINACDLFVLENSETFTETVEYSAEKYADLLSTFSDFYKIEDNKRDAIKEIVQMIKERGGSVKLDIVNQLEICRKA